MSVDPLTFGEFVDTTESEQLWQIYNAIAGGSGDITNYALESGGNLADINTKFNDVLFSSDFIPSAAGITVGQGAGEHLPASLQLNDNNLSLLTQTLAGNLAYYQASGEFYITPGNNFTKVSSGLAGEYYLVGGKAVITIHWQSITTPQAVSVTGYITGVGNDAFQIPVPIYDLYNKQYVTTATAGTIGTYTNVFVGLVDTTLFYDLKFSVTSNLTTGQQMNFTIAETQLSAPNWLFDSSGNLNTTNAPQSSAGTYSTGSASTTASTILAASTSRRYLLIQNIGSVNPLYITTDGSTPSTTNGLFIPANGGSLQFNNSWVPNGVIKAYSTTTNYSILTA